MESTEVIKLEAIKRATKEDEVLLAALREAFLGLHHLGERFSGRGCYWKEEGIERLEGAAAS